MYNLCSLPDAKSAQKVPQSINIVQIVATKHWTPRPMQYVAVAGNEAVRVGVVLDR